METPMSPVSIFTEELRLAMRRAKLLLLPNSRKDAYESADLESLLGTLSGGDTSLRSILSVVAQTKLKFIRRATVDKSIQDFTKETLAVYTASLVGWSFVQVLTTPHEGPVVKQAHWLARCYSRNFGEIVNARGRVRLAKLTVTKDGTLNAASLVNDLAFAHPTSKSGYYPLPVERLFALIEGRYAASVTDVINGAQPTAFDYVAMYSFYVTNEVRIPPLDGKQDGRYDWKASHKVSKKSIRSDIFRAIDHFGEQEMMVVKTNAHQYLAPFVPRGTRKTADGNKVRVMPLSSDYSLVMSEEKMTEQQAVEQAERAITSTIKRAARFRSSVYSHPFAPQPDQLR